MGSVRITLLTLLLSAICQTTKMLIFTHRHGVRNPDEPLPFMPRLFNPLLRDELTQVGIQQEYLLGKYIRSKYSSFIPLAFSPNQTYIRSTNTNRTIQSAHCLSYGLFQYSQQVSDRQVLTSRPPVASDLSIIERQLGQNITGANFVPSIIDVVPQKDDSLLSADSGLCKYYRTLQLQVYQTNEWKTQVKIFETEFLPILAVMFDFDISVVKEENYIDLLDFLICSHYNNYISINSELLGRLQNIYSELFTMQMVGPPSMNYTMAKISATNILRDIVEKFERKIQDSSYEMLYIEYSFHDTNIMHIVHTLDLIKGSPYIRFASNIIFELRGDNSVRMVYNGDELLNSPFEIFKKTVESSIYSQKEWKKLCN